MREIGTLVCWATLSRLTDTFWNSERLSGRIPEVDAITIAYALKAVSEYLGGGWV